MAQPHTGNVAKKRKLSKGDNGAPVQQKLLKHQHTTLIGPHETILAELAPKYHIKSTSVISSSKIRQRVTSAADHLVTVENTDKPCLVLLHARTDCLSKLITIVETLKRVLSQEGKPWWQYNQLYEQPERAPKKQDVVEETMLAKEGEGAKGEDDEEEEADEDYFETMGSRLEQAIHPEPPARAVKSLRIFLATTAVPELKLKSDVTVQTSSDGS
ncbi:hypothetical protein NLU13_7549 [Sarocladium strictum]|uniref:DNA/RNA-binding protein Alba-like domain-containing protein n=1 Tax=Sarocladium strictum TaxID=5046 RepID=A0AA39GDB2_SARSR|nr:hypothetical protein NLU13_7549 [Sarocladium strictum]